MFPKAFINKSISLLVILSLLFINGCWDRNELDSLAIVAAVAFDTHTNNKVLLTAQIIDVGAAGSPSAGGGTGAGKPYWNINSEGNTVFDAIRNTTHESPRKLFWAHNQVIIFSEELARKGIKDYLDFYLRDGDTRNTVWVVIAEGKASDILDIETRLEKIPGMHISQLIKDRTPTSQSTGVNMHEFTHRILSDTTAPVASLLRIVKTEQEKNPDLEGTAVFNKELKMAGKLNGKETRGMLWVLGEVDSGVITVQPSGSDSKAALEILHAKSKIIPEITENNVRINIKVKMESILAEDNTDEDLLSPATWEKLSTFQAAAIRNEIKLALDKSRELNADIFGFGDSIHKKYPREWKEMKTRWEEIFPGLEINIQVDSKLRRPGLTEQTINYK